MPAPIGLMSVADSWMREGNAGLVQSQRQGQTADSGAYDNRFHAECFGPRTKLVLCCASLSHGRDDSARGRCYSSKARNVILQNLQRPLTF